jgi:inorganic pyrophosphatase
VADQSHTYRDTRLLKDLPGGLLTEIEHFFVSYHEMENKPFKPLHRRGPTQARRLVQRAMHQYLVSQQSSLEKAS